LLCGFNTPQKKGAGFISKNIDFRSRTKDQMEQAGRSGKQNIAEGYAMQRKKLSNTKGIDLEE